MDEPRRTDRDDLHALPARNISSIAVWRAAKNDPNYRAEAARQAASAAFADVEDRVMEWCDGVGREAWDDL